MTELTIRPAVAADEAGWVACAQGLFAEDGAVRDPGGIDVSWPVVHGPDSFRAGLADDDRLTLVVEADGEVVGTLNAVVAVASPTRPIRLATLRSLYVRPGFRDGGVGARLVARFRDWAGQRGAVRVGVTAFAANEAAVRFYRRQGLVPFHVTLEADV